MTISFSACDFCDAYKDDHIGALRVLPAIIKEFGGLPTFAEQVVTVRCHENNTMVKQVLEHEPGDGRVLVIDGAGSVHRTLLSGNIASVAARNGWDGVMVHVAVRDVAELRATV